MDRRKKKSPIKNSFIIQLVLLISIALVGCTQKVVVYHNAEPEIAHLSTMNCSSGVRAASSFVRYHEIREENDRVLWPEGLPWETTMGVKATDGPMELRLRIANGLSRPVAVYYREIVRRGGKIWNDKTVPIYSGKLPYRNYAVPLPMKGGDTVEAWFEIHTLDYDLPCMTPVATYHVIPKDGKLPK